MNATAKKFLLLGAFSIVLSTSAMGEYYWDKEVRLTPPKRMVLQSESPAPRAAASPEDAEQLVEEKLFKYVETSFASRDQSEFERLVAFYRTSFPYSERLEELAEFEKQFYYFRPLALEEMQSSMVHLPFPQAKSLEELKDYFRALRLRGVTSVQMEVAQYDGYRNYLFTDSNKLEGYYFKAQRGPVAQDILKELIDLAHDENLKFYASFSLRRHPGLTKQPIYMMDEAWNFLGNDTETTNKIDLFHVAGKSYLVSLIEDLSRYNIDGIVIKDDFTYQRHEGFSKQARKNFLLDTGMGINFHNLFVSQKPGKGDFGLLSSREFWSIADWRSGELRQTLWEMVDKIREKKPNLDLGIEISPDMILDEVHAKQEYSTGLKYLQDLPVDFYLLKRRVGDKISKASNKEMLQAGIALSEHSTGRIIIQTPLDRDTMNLVKMNHLLHQQGEWKGDIPKIGWAWGSVNRLRGYDITQFAVNEDQLVEIEEEDEEDFDEQAPQAIAPQDIEPIAVGSAQTSAASPPAQ